MFGRFLPNTTAIIYIDIWTLNQGHKLSYKNYLQLYIYF